MRNTSKMIGLARGHQSADTLNFDNSHPKWCELIFHCGFGIQFFLYLLATFMSSLEKCLFKIFAYFSIWIICGVCN